MTYTHLIKPIGERIQSPLRLEEFMLRDRENHTTRFVFAICPICFQGFKVDEEENDAGNQPLKSYVLHMLHSDRAHAQWRNLTRFKAEPFRPRVARE
ncbi:unnamed protein product [Ambrosiozyma monospora]|uniref:Unnamed protein product n=1 Tax=Ambrosiozyma monospora TaxID=43982 RepID=A0A9W6YTZ1_AMBMO|nr:unnamed protein product [Ambrosiozyma monospora]